MQRQAFAPTQYDKGPCFVRLLYHCCSSSLLLMPLTITKIYLYNFDPLKPHFYIIKLWFTGVYIIFLFCSKNLDCGYSLEPPRRGGSNEYPQSMFWVEIWKISEFLSWNFQFLVVKFSIYLIRRVFVMKGSKWYWWPFADAQDDLILRVQSYAFKLLYSVD